MKTYQMVLGTALTFPLLWGCSTPGTRTYYEPAPGTSVVVEKDSPLIYEEAPPEVVVGESPGYWQQRAYFYNGNYYRYNLPGNRYEVVPGTDRGRYEQWHHQGAPAKRIEERREPQRVQQEQQPVREPQRVQREQQPVRDQRAPDRHEENVAPQRIDRSQPPHDPDDRQGPPPGDMREGHIPR